MLDGDEGPKSCAPLLPNVSMQDRQFPDFANIWHSMASMFSYMVSLPAPQALGAAWLCVSLHLQYQHDALQWALHLVRAILAHVRIPLAVVGWGSSNKLSAAGFLLLNLRLGQSPVLRAVVSHFLCSLSHSRVPYVPSLNMCPPPVMLLLLLPAQLKLAMFDYNVFYGSTNPTAAMLLFIAFEVGVLRTTWGVDVPVLPVGAVAVHAAIALQAWQ
jgi:hypothetical protein